MGEAKELHMREQGKRDIAMELAMTAKVLLRCPVHEDYIFLGSRDIEEAYKLASARFKRGQLNEFESQREVTDLIRAIVEGYTDMPCPYGEGFCPDPEDDSYYE